MSTLNVDDINLGGRTNNFRGTDIASAATVDLSSATGDLVHITGTTGITSFGTAPQAGVKRNVIFDGALVLTNGANLSLPGGVDITTVAGDSAVFIADGASSWKCISYSSNSPLKAADIASSGTTSIAAYPGELVHITGTTTITSLGTAPQAGVQKTVIFDGILTLTNGVNIVLPGGVNILTAANDSAVFISDSTTVWKCVQYTRAAIEVLEGTYLNTQVIAATGTYTPTPGARSALLKMVGGGGAGGSSSAAVAGSACGGGGSGGYAEYELSNISGTYACTIGTGGAPVTAAAGGAGLNTTFVDGATTVTAFGGAGGAFVAGSAAIKYTAGGAGGVVSTSGTVNGAGVSGGVGMTSSVATVGKAGNGGESFLGGAGLGGLYATAVGAPGTSAVANTGSGGGGAGTGGLIAASGGNGASGIIIITEYR